MTRCCASSNAPSSKRHFCIAVASVVLAAGALVAVAIPVIGARRAHQQLLTASRNGSATSRGTAQGGFVHESAAFMQLLPDNAPECNGIKGLCSVPIRLATFPGTHNSNAVKNREFIAEAQELGFKEQLEAGARLFDIDYAGGQFGPRFGHCLSCFCSFSSNPADSDPVQVFQVMADFLAANPRDVIVLGLSNINCGDKAAARSQLLGLLAQSPLHPYIATQVVGPNTTLGNLVDTNQRAVLLFYDQWSSAEGHQVGSKSVPSQPLLRLYGGDTTIDASGADAIDKQVAVELLSDIGSQFKAAAPSVDMPWRVLGLFPSTCLSCRNALQCGPISCAVKANSEPYIMYQLGKLTAQWLAARHESELVPAVNGYQVDYFGVAAGNRGPVQAAQKLNRGFAWMYTLKPDEAAVQGLGNCVWVLDDDAYAGGLACVHHGQVHIDTLLGIKSSSSSDDILSGIFSSFAGLSSSSSGSASKSTSAASGTASGAVASSSSSALLSASSAVNSSSSSSSNAVPAASGRKLAAAAAMMAAATADAITADTASSSTGRSNRWILLPANGKLQLQLLLKDQVVRRVLGMPGKLTWVDVGMSADSLQVLWPPSSKRKLAF